MAKSERLVEVEPLSGGGGDQGTGISGAPTSLTPAPRLLSLSAATVAAAEAEVVRFGHIAEELRVLMEEAASVADGRGPHGPYARRAALLRTKLEEAWLQARQGVHEAHYSQ